MSEMSQQDFVRAAQAGDRDAFAPLVHRYEIRVRATCRRFTHDDDDAEDLVLESFVEAISNSINCGTPSRSGPGF